jgi:hypothetical protein
VEEIAPSFPFYKLSGRDEFWHITQEKKFDSNGVVMRDYGEQGVQYHPVMIASYAIRLYDTFLNTRDRKCLEQFLVQAHWLRDNAREWVSGVWAWVYDIPNVAYNAEGQWISGMAQGLGLAVLAEAYSITKDCGYVEAGRKALSPFSSDLADGGVRTVDSSSGWWYEEVAGPGVPSSKILNGFIYALAGLNYYSIITDDEIARSLYEKGLIALNDNIDQFDGDYTSRYCVGLDGFRPTGTFYNLVHVQQLIWLYNKTGNAQYIAYALKFYAYQHDSEIANTLTAKEKRGSAWETLRNEDLSVLNGVKGYWHHTSKRDIAIEVTPGSSLPIKGVVLREWQPHHLSQYQIFYYDPDSGRWDSIATVCEGQVTEGNATIDRLHIQNRDAFVHVIKLSRNIITPKLRIIITDPVIGLRQVMPLYSHQLIAVTDNPTDVFRTPSLFNLFDGNNETKWSLSKEKTSLLLHKEEEMRGTVTNILLQTIDGKQQMALDVPDDHSIVRQIDGGTVSVQTSDITDNIVEMELHLHEVSGVHILELMCKAEASE